MTPDQEKQIRNFRAQGAGYKAIASYLHIPRDAVRYYCKKHHLTGYDPAVRLNMRRMEDDPGVCSYCGGVIAQNPTGRPKKFCSDECRKKWWAMNRDKIKKSDGAVYLFTCKRCGRQFSSYGRKGRKYCSRECYVKGRFYDGIPDEEIPSREVVESLGDAEARIVGQTEERNGKQDGI